MSKLVHAMIRVLDETRSRAYYAEAFGLEVSDRFDFPDFTLIYMRAPGSPFELELTVNKGRDKPYDLGDGYGHIAFTVDDLEAAHARLKDKGLPATDPKSLEHEGQRLARFFFATDPDGYKIEVIERSGRFA
ncbi:MULTISPECIES: VOC family protein [Methylobacterium]|uniref:Aldoketomutase n=2 Tax=Pseudomonadota TaxID=1224 RepID=A0ABQ4T2U4_9HYPH|nr:MULTISPECIES: VOC family protein [Methylobacterium]PIU04683.1 MAG: lactoylglutathione lyase [Methylobacterium sp. CG09_land_8_20_14_0_10_71_15]PIU13687.1 MAG: lactoylglutathione lyase [Methylobacterium sp. CG08_land_8_20_14_0_20_71_15]GBU17403.1 lactoylglutathione lyase [Methylobacterium sp.]GJE08349.1 Lactoylglutathione lyase [Methylobacterium jeotgali]